MVKLYKKIFLVIIIISALICLWNINNVKVYASSDTYNILNKKEGAINTAESEQFQFQVPIESIITLKFKGTDGYSSGTYGDFNIQIINSNNEVVFEEKKFIEFNDVDVSTKLSKGSYKLKFTESGEFLLNYIFYIVGKPTVSVNAESIKLNKNKITLKKGKKTTLKVTVSPYYITGNVKWNSSNKKIITVDNEGKIEAKNLGTAKVTAKIGGKTATCQITVDKVDTKKIIRKKSSSLKNLVKYISGYKKAKWSSSNKSIATVSKDGKVSARKNGKCNIICKIGKKKYTIPVKVVSLVSAEPDGVDEEAIYNDAWVKVTNNSNKKITYMTLQIYQYNNKGSKLTSPYSSYYINENIKSNSDNSFSFWVNDDTKKIKVKILKVWFSDGTTWKP